MIDGFKVDVSAEELVEHLDGRIRHHRERTQECETRLRQLHTLQQPAPHDEEDAFEMCASSRVYSVERMASRHRSREVFLMFARNHVVSRETYRLTEEDLRLLEWLPTEEPNLTARY